MKKMTFGIILGIAFTILLGALLVKVINTDDKNYLVRVRQGKEVYFYHRYGKLCHPDEEPVCIEKIDRTDESSGIRFMACAEWSCLSEH